MRCGLYGKLPSKRDFIAVGASREFLAIWEPWLQGGISASRMKLGANWQAEFLRAPIWRFWLGTDLCAGSVLGAMMPSVDGIGRYFPLTVFARAEPGEGIAPPEFDTQEDWFVAAEELLLSALTDTNSFEMLTGSFGRLPLPKASVQGTAPAKLFRAPDGTVATRVGSSALSTAFAELRQIDHDRVYGRCTYWWTLGGESYPPRLLLGRRMPDPYLFTGMLTGRFEEAL